MEICVTIKPWTVSKFVEKGMNPCEFKSYSNLPEAKGIPPFFPKNRMQGIQKAFIFFYWY